VTGRFVALVCLVVGCVRPVAAITWEQIAEDELTCVTFATPEERAQIDAPLLPRALTPPVLAAYFGRPAKDDVHERLRYLTALSALAYFADRTNDQVLRMNLLTTIGVFAQRYADGGQGAVFLQISRCARAHIVSCAIERDEPKLAIQMSGDLAERIRASPPGPAVEDWPLLLALQELGLAPESAQGLPLLVAVAVERAAALESAEPKRASRLYGAVARAYVTLGEGQKADAHAAKALALVIGEGNPATIVALVPALYDIWTLRYGTAKANELTQAITTKFPLPERFADPQTEFEVRLRMAYVFEGAARFDESAQQRAAANKALLTTTVSIPYQRAAFDRLDAFSSTVTDPVTNMSADAAWATLVRSDGARAKNDYLTAYRGAYDTIVGQAQHSFVADARDKLDAQRKIDRMLDIYAVLRDALPAYRNEIDDRSFAFAQLASYGRVTLATVAGGLDGFSGDAATKANVERFFTLSTQNSVWLRGVWNRLLGTDGNSFPTPQQLWQAIQVLSIQYNETQQSFDQYVAFVRQKAPDLGALITPRPLPLLQARAALAPGQVLVATLVARKFTYVFALTNDRAAFTRTAIPRAAVRALVQKLRQSLLAKSTGGRLNLPPFDAASAHALYTLTFGSVAPLLQGASHVIWYGHDALGSVPPAVLVVEPTRDTLSTADELATARFFGDRYPVSVLADLSLLATAQRSVQPLQRPEAFLGVGAPQLTDEELEGGGAATVFDFSRGLDAASLADLPKLPESADELRALADTFGADHSALLLGAKATRQGIDAAAPSRYRVIAFATHGFKPGEIAGIDEPALLLAPPGGTADPLDGLLTSRQIAGLHLGADLVVLSACNSANGDGRPRAEAFSGLAQAFFTAGAQSLLVTHWPVVSSAAAHLTVLVAEGITRDSLPLDVSLQRAVKSLRESGRGNAIESHPAYWGPFVAIGTASSARVVLP
jgi:CHAT domain-containing protein